MLNNKISFGLRGSIADLIGSQVPNFSRNSPTWLESEFSGSLRIEPVPAFIPAISREDGTIYLEPECENLVTYNLDLSDSSWVKGSNVVIQPNEVETPDTSVYKGARVNWSSGDNEATQVIRKQVLLEPGEYYTLSAFLLLPNQEQAGSKDVLRVTGSVASPATIPLPQLNTTPGRYRIVQHTFQVEGSQPRLNYGHDKSFRVTAVSTTSVDVLTDKPVVTDQFVGGFLRFDNNNQLYQITSNTPSNNGQFTFFVEAANLITQGVVVGSRAFINPPELVTLNIEFYVESSLELHFGGIQLEKRQFRTSMIFQNQDLIYRANSQLQFRQNPIARLRNFAISISIKEWRGDGIIFDAGNIKAEIIQGQIQIAAGNSIINIVKALQSQFRLLIQISEDNSSISVFLNSLLEARNTIFDFTGSHTMPLSFNSQGYRAIEQFLIIDQPLEGITTEVGSMADGEILELQTDFSLDAATIAANTPAIPLPLTTIPGKLPPIAQSQIVGINSATNTITVADSTGFVAQKNVSVVRDEQVILSSRILTITGQNIQLEVMYGITFNDTLVYGNVEQPGKASIRFPYTPVDQARIISVDSVNRRITIPSTLAFTTSRAFISTQDFRDVAEVIIQIKDDIAGTLTLDSVENIVPDLIISQPSDEMILSPDCYEVFFLQEIPGVDVGTKYTNGITVLNYNQQPVEAQLAIRAIGY